MKLIYVVSVKGGNEMLPRMVRAFKNKEDADKMAEIVRGYVDEVELGF